MHSFEAAQPSANLHKPHRCSIRPITSSAPALDSGSLRLPHFGDCTHDGQPDLARALADQPVRVLDEHVEAAKALQRDPDAAGVPVVDEDRRARRSAGGSWSTGRRCPSGRTWPAAAARRSGCARRRAARRAAPRAGTRRGRSSPSSYHSACVVNECGGRSSAVEVDDLVVGQALALVGVDLLGDGHRGRSSASRRGPRGGRAGARSPCRSRAWAACTSCRRTARRARGGRRGRARAPRRSARGAGRRRRRGSCWPRARTRPCPSSSPLETSTTATLSGDAERSDTRAAG